MESRDIQEFRQIKIASGLNIVLGIWLLVAPFLLGYSGASTAALWNDIIVGVIVLVLAWIRVANPARSTWMSWTNVVLGLWLVVASFILGYSSIAAAIWNDILVGLSVAVLGAWSALATRAVHS